MIEKGFLLMLTVCMLFTSCNFFSKNERYTDRDYDILNEEDLEEDIVPYSEDISSLPEIVRPDIVDGIGSIDIHKYDDQKVQVEIGSFGYRSIKAKISSADPAANIRFAQIILPNETADGPFGQEFQYDLPMDGIYKLIIDDNMMAREPWTGYFTLDFELER